MQAMIGLLHASEPALYLDLHVTDGLDYQYDITYTMRTGWRATGLVSVQFRLAGPLFPSGHGCGLETGRPHPGPLLRPTNDRDLTEESTPATVRPGFPRATANLRHVPAVLLETHSLKPYRQRVLGTYVFIESALRSVGEHGTELRAAIAADRTARPDKIPVNWAAVTGRKPTWISWGSRMRIMFRPPPA